MNLLWNLILPGGLFLALWVTARLALKLKFFSHAARDLAEIDIANEVREVRVHELEILLSAKADGFFKDEPGLTFWQRREVVSRRLSEIRKWLRFMIGNAELFQQVARFRIAELELGGTRLEAELCAKNSSYRLMDRACVVHVMAAIGLGKLALVEMLRVVWPMYLPRMAGRFQIGDRDLIVWYRHLMRQILEVAEEYETEYEGLYERFILQLTGAPTLEHAIELNRI